MKYDLRPENILKLENATALLTEEQKIALQWQGSLSNQAALCRNILSMSEHARLGIMRSAMMFGFSLYQNRANQLGYQLPRPELAPKATPALDMPRPAPKSAFRPRLRPDNY